MKRLFRHDRGTVVALWLAWALALSLFQAFVAARVPSRPVDRALPWTAAQTGRDGRSVNARLSVPLLAERVAWDSEFYLSIAIAGYDDPMVRKVIMPGSGTFSLNYAFMPGYPLAIRVAMAPLIACGMSGARAAVIAGVSVSLVSALCAALALARLAGGGTGIADGKARPGDAGNPLKRARNGVVVNGSDEATRAAWFMLIFPAGFFLAQVYTEAFFLALALWAIVFAREGRWTLSAIVSSFAILTRAAGVALVPAIAIVAGQRLMRGTRSRLNGNAEDQASERSGAGIQTRSGLRLSEGFAMLEALLVPIAAFLAWKLSVYGTRFDVVERAFFGRVLDPLNSIRSWALAFGSIAARKSDTAAYYALELASAVLALASAIWGFRRHPDLAIFGLATLALSFFSAVPQGLVRYVLSCPLIFILAARLTRNRGAERAYSAVSVLLMGFLAALFSLDMWVG